MVAGLDQPVGVERERRAVRQIYLDLLERLAAHAQRHARGHLQHQRRLVGLDEYGRQMAGVGERAPPGDGVVDGVDAGREVDLGEIVVGAALRSGGVPQAAGDLVERAQDFGGLQVGGQRQGPYGGAQFAHRDGGAQPSPHHVADDEGGAVSGQFDHIEPVAAHLGGRIAGQIAAGDVESGGLRVSGGSRLR